MKIKKYRAADSNQAMRMVKAAHGPDAVVLDCYSVAGGVELVVSWEDGESVGQAQREPAAQLGAVAMLEARQQAKNEAAQQAALEKRQNSGAAKVVWSQDEELLTMKREMAEMKQLLMSQFKDHSWQDADHRAPQQKGLHRFLAALDIEPVLAGELLAQIPAGEAEGIAREMLKMMLLRRLPVATPPSGGAIGLVGPQGVGKTTTIAKLAAQHVLSHGRDDIAIITTDTARVGAQEQLRAYGGILQLPVHCVSNLQEALTCYGLLRKKSLLLVDTAGVSFRDRQGIVELQAMTAAMPGLSLFLNLPADSQSHVQREIIDAYQPLGLQGAVISRIDEASCLGSLLSNLISRQLPAVWCSNGPNVPRNLSPADAGKLMKMALRMSSILEREHRDANPMAAVSGQPVPVMA